MRKEIRIEYLGLNRIPGLSLPRLRMKFLNSNDDSDVIEVPNKFGGYVIASGCGSGKTTIIKQLIRDLNTEGILYSAFTIEECNDMFNYVVSLIESGASNLTMNDIMLIHSGECPDYRFIDLFNEWRNKFNNDISYTNSKKVLICTHHKLFNTEPSIFLKYTGNPISLDMNDLDSPIGTAVSSTFQGIRYYPRQLILIDELPTCSPFKVKVNPLVIKSLGDQDKEVYYDPNESDPEKRYKTRPIIPRSFSRPNSFRDLLYNYDTEINGSGLDIINSNTEKDKKFLRYINGLIWDNYDTFSKEKSDISISYTISDFIIENKTETRILLFEGTGDLSFYNSKRFEVLTLKGKKYSSDIHIEKFHQNLNRKISKEADENEVFDDILLNVNELENIIRSNERTLVVTWKNFKEDSGIKIADKFNIKRSVINSDINLPEIYKCKLRERGLINGYEIIHYMGGLDKATNLFREFDSIVFLGNFRVPNYVVSDFNNDYKVETDIEKYTLYQLVQAVCRTRIRNHKGESINMYFSDDWDDEIINKLSDYINSDKISESRIKQVYDSSLLKFRPKWRDAIRKLGEIDEKLKDAISYGDSYYMSISLNDICNLIPLHERKVRVYYPLINYLRKYNIELNIISSNNNQYTVNRVS